jgi:adenine deaminase
MEASAELANRIAVARGDRPADVVLHGGTVLSVFTGELLRADVVIAGARPSARTTTPLGASTSPVAFCCRASSMRTCTSNRRS